MHLLDLEEAEESAALRHRLSTWGLKRLEREGYCITSLSAYWLEANQFGRPVASFSFGPGIRLSDNKLEFVAFLIFSTTLLSMLYFFRNGMQVLLSRVDPLKEITATGSVISRTDTQLRVCFANKFHKFDLNGLWRLDLGRPNLMYERMCSAISYLPNDLKVIEEASDASQEYILQGTRLRDVLLRSFQPHQTYDADQASDTFKPPNSTAVDEDSSGPNLSWEDMGAFKHDQRIVSWAKRYMMPNPIVLDSDPPLELNDSQRRAMAAMIGRKVSLIQGVLYIRFISRHYFLSLSFLSLLVRGKRKPLLKL